MSEIVPPASSLPPRWRVPRLASDARLAQRAARGDRRAFAEIFERHHQALFRYCRSILRDPEDAGDALQSTMAAALRGLEGETREIALKSWLFRIAHNESLSLLRRRRGHAPLEEVDVPGRSGPATEVLQSERMRELVEDVHALPDRQRGALVMRELSGLDYPDIAAAFGVAEGAARQAVYEAREMLHELTEGRAMACADVRELISARDGRLLRGRKVRAHLRACEECREFRAMIHERRAGLAALAPPLAAPLAASMLHGLLGAGNGAAGVAASGSSVTAASAASGKSVAGIALTAKATGTAGMVVKAAAVLAAGVTLAGGAVVAEHELGSDPARPTSSARPGAASGLRPRGTVSGATPISARGQDRRERGRADSGAATGHRRGATGSPSTAPDERRSTSADGGVATGRDRAPSHPSGSERPTSSSRPASPARRPVNPSAARPAPGGPPPSHARPVVPPQANGRGEPGGGHPPGDPPGGGERARAPVARGPEALPPALGRGLGGAPRR